MGSHLKVVDKDLIDAGLYEKLNTATGLHFHDDENEDLDEFMEIHEKRTGITANTFSRF